MSLVHTLYGAIRAGIARASKDFKDIGEPLQVNVVSNETSEDLSYVEIVLRNKSKVLCSLREMENKLLKLQLQYEKKVETTNLVGGFFDSNYEDRVDVLFERIQKFVLGGELKTIFEVTSRVMRDSFSCVVMHPLMDGISVWIIPNSAMVEPTADALGTDEYRFKFFKKDHYGMLQATRASAELYQVTNTAGATTWCQQESFIPNFHTFSVVWDLEHKEPGQKIFDFIKEVLQGKREHGETILEPPEYNTNPLYLNTRIFDFKN
jgi:hypothetical protein